MNGVRIESLGKLSIDVYLDDLHIESECFELL